MSVSTIRLDDGVRDETTRIAAEMGLSFNVEKSFPFPVKLETAQKTVFDMSSDEFETTCQEAVARRTEITEMEYVTRIDRESGMIQKIYKDGRAEEVDRNEKRKAITDAFIDMDIRNMNQSKKPLIDSRGLTPRDYYALFSDIWSAETCAPRMRKGWTKENKTLGQCSITAFLLQDIFGGDVYGVPLEDGNYHCFNVVEDYVFDLTKEQFDDVSLDYSKCVMQSRNVHFAKEEKRQRYELLRSRLMEKLSGI